MAHPSPITHAEPHPPEQSGNPSPVSPGRRRAWLWPALLGVGAAAFSLAHLVWSQVHPIALPQALVAQTAARPYQYRTLVPSLVRAVLTLVSHPADRAGALLLMLAVNTASLLALSWVLPRLMTQGDPEGRSIDRASRLTPFLLYPALWTLFFPPISHALWYPSDFPGVLFVTLGLFLLSHRRWLPFILVYLIGCFNRETVLLVTFAHMAWALNSPDRREHVPVIALQGVLWCAVKGWLAWRYVGNPGNVLLEWHLEPNLRFLLTIRGWIRMALGPGLLWLPLLAVRRSWPPGFLTAILPGVIPYFGIMLMVGNLGEFRIFAETVPFALPLLGKVILAQRGESPAAGPRT